MVERLFSAHQVADLLGTSQGAVVTWIEKGWLPYRRLPDGPIRISEKGLVRFLKDRGVDIGAIMAKVALHEDQESSGAELLEASPEASWQAGPQSATGGESTHNASVEETLLEESGLEESGWPSSAISEAVEPVPVQPPDPVHQVAEAMLKDAVAGRISHIHLDPGPDGLSLRVRIDGVLHTKANFRARLPKDLAPRLIPHLKTLAGMGPEPAGYAQAAEFTRSIDGQEVTFRLAVCPTVHGERLVVHIAVRREVLGLAQLGLDQADLSLLRPLLSEPCGIILVAGPPGSGRATTLQALLAELGTPERNLIALKTDAAAGLDGTTCCTFSDREGFTRAEALRAFGDQDADVISVEDIADGPTAAAAVELAIGGRMVLASLPARNFAGALEMMLASAGPWAVASSLLAVISQRTVRKVCPECREQAEPTDDLLVRLNLRRAGIAFPVYRGRGCKECSHTGYLGRTGVFSVLCVDGPLAAMLRRGVDPAQIELAVARAKTSSLTQARLEKVRAGITSLEEICRAYTPTK